MILTGVVIVVALAVCYGLLPFQLHQQSVLFAVSVFGFMLWKYPRHDDAPLEIVPTVAPKVKAPAFVAPGTASAAKAPAPPVQVKRLQPERATYITEPTDEQEMINAYLEAKGTMLQAMTVAETPDYFCYVLDTLPGANFAPLRSSLNDLANKIYRLRGNRGEPVTVTLSEQPPYLQVTAPARRVLSWSKRSKKLKSHVAQVGAYWTHESPTLQAIDFTDQRQWFMAAFSSSGGGKSMLLRAAALSLLETSAPGDTEFYFIDLDSNQYDAYRRLPQVRCVAETDAQALALLTHLAKQVQLDRELVATVRRILVIDEFQMLSAQSQYSDEIMDAMAVLAQRGRKHGINLLLATQDPTGDNFPVELQRNVKVVLAGLTEDDSYLKRFFGIDGADLLRGDGDFIFKSAGRQMNFKGFLITPEDERSTLDAIVARWGEDRSTLEFEEEGVSTDTRRGSDGEAPERLAMPKPAMERRQQRPAIDARRIWPYMGEAYDFEAGRLRDGWGTTLIEVLYGEPKPNAGNYATRLNQALDYALTNLTNLTNEPE